MPRAAASSGSAGQRPCHPELVCCSCCLLLGDAAAGLRRVVRARVDDVRRAPGERDRLVAALERGVDGRGRRSGAPPSAVAPASRSTTECVGGAEVDDLADHARATQVVRPGRRRRGRCEHQDLLGADARTARRRPAAAAPRRPRAGWRCPTKPATNGAGRAARRARPGSPTCSIAAVVEDRDPVAHGQRLLLVVGDEHEGDADLALDLLQLDLHLPAQLEVERAERLVEQQHLRAG